jgi:hypothetical protein
MDGSRHEPGFDSLLRAVNAVQMHAPVTYYLADRTSVVVTYFPDEYEYLLAFADADGIEQEFEFATPEELVARSLAEGWLLA